MLLKFAFSRAGAYTAIVLAIIAAFAYVYWQGRSTGEEVILDEIRKRDDKVIHNADEAARTVDDCFNAGGVWDRATGKCLKRVPGVQGQPPGR